ncbi:hypothetical protein F5B21DRAFT_506456 [Xylaria acuta]|nr:hypothetical protein F5B21DRAFT_506456 [Xylaria acuta]
MNIFEHFSDAIIRPNYYRPSPQLDPIVNTIMPSSSQQRSARPSHGGNNMAEQRPLYMLDRYINADATIIERISGAVKGSQSSTVGGCVVYGFDPESSWANYNTPFHTSLHKRQLSAAALLLEHDAQIDLHNALARTPLHEAIARSDSEAVRFLIDKGSDLNATSEERSFEDDDTHLSGTAGILPLHEVIRTWTLEAAELLVE